jgi:hypothetical protein
MSRNGYGMVQQFVTYFYKHIRDASPRDVETMYTLTFHKIGADFFPNGPWPHMNELRHLVDDDVFWILYQVRYPVKSAAFHPRIEAREPPGTQPAPLNTYFDYGKYTSRDLGTQQLALSPLGACKQWRSTVRADEIPVHTVPTRTSNR